MLRRVSRSLLLVLLVSTAPTAKPADAQTAIPPQAPIYGPDRDKWMDYGNRFVVNVPSGKTLRLTFIARGWYENEAIVNNSTGSWRLRRGNYGMGTDPWSYTNSTAGTVQFVITAWHKDGPYPSASLPWHQSAMHVFQNQPNDGIVGFEDSNFRDEPYRDVMVQYSIRSPSGSNGGGGGGALQRSVFRIADGSFQKLDGNQWVERKDDGRVFRFVETGRNADYVELYDAGRRMYVRLFNNFGAYRTSDSGQWFRWPGSDGAWVQ